MPRFIVLLLSCLVLAACGPDDDQTGSITKTSNSCAANLYASYNPKAMDQCVAVCTKCDHGTMTTCSTSCTLRGAH
jgi:hypothetical protein